MERVMADDSMFRCAGLGLDSVLQFGSLGSYDGAGAWSLALASISSDDEQRMAELHEGLHHELQISSGWGLISSMAWLLSSRGFRTHALGEVFRVMVEESRQTHEIFATALSATTDGIDRAYDLLAANPRYLGYLSRGLALVDPADAEFWQFHHAAMTAVLSVCMRPAATLGLLTRGFRALTRRDLDPDRDGPDRRLAAFERLGGPASWRPVFTDLLERCPDRGGDPGPGSRRRLPEDPEAMDRLHRFEGEILLPQCYAHVCAVLDRAGLPSVGSRDQSRLAQAARSAVIAADPGLAGHLVLVRERRPLHEETLDLERQRIVLRERLPVRLAAAGDLAAFQAQDDRGNRFACAFWIDQAVVRKQFAFPDGTELPEIVPALVNRSGAGPFVSVGLMPPGTTPQQCQLALGDTPLVVLATHATLARHADTLAMLQMVKPVFVLMDLPVGRHVGHWISQGATVRICASSIERSGRRLGLATFAIGRQHPFIFLRIGSETSTYVLVDQLRQRHPDRVEVEDRADEPVAQEHAANLVLSTWHVLDQRGAT
jgi:hypothetical protein